MVANDVQSILKMRNDRIKTWGEIETHLSKGSKDEIKSLIEYENLKTAWDVRARLLKPHQRGLPESARND